MLAAKRPSPIAVMMTLYAGDPLDLFDRALRSIEGQRFDGDIRVYLCVDGPLPRAHRDWLSNNKPRFHRVLHNEVNLGLAKSLNRLIDALADEELVFRMDGDDVSLADRFAKQAAMMRAQPELSLIGCQAADIDDAGRVIGPRRFPEHPETVRRALSRVAPVLHPAFCLRRSVLRDPTIRYPDAHLSEDLAFLVRLTERGHAIGNHPDTLLHWRTGAGFFARRKDWRRGWTELKWYARALRATGRHRSPAILFPLARFSLRLLPAGLIRALYRTQLRDRLLGDALR